MCRSKKKITNEFVHINYQPKTFVYAEVLNLGNFNGRGDSCGFRIIQYGQEIIFVKYFQFCHF